MVRDDFRVSSHEAFDDIESLVVHARIEISQQSAVAFQIVLVLIGTPLEMGNCLFRRFEAIDCHPNLGETITDRVFASDLRIMSCPVPGFGDT